MQSIQFGVLSVGGVLPPDGEVEGGVLPPDGEVEGGVLPPDGEVLLAGVQQHQLCPQIGPGTPAPEPFEHVPLSLQ